jgi:hypothetical protein
MEEQQSVLETRIYSFGDILVGLDSEEINEPEQIIEVRKMFSKLAEDLKDNYNENRSPVKSLLFDQAIGDITSALLISEKLLKMK